MQMIPSSGAYISHLLMIASTDLPPTHGGTYELAAHRFLPQTHTCLKAQKTISITERPSSTVAAERNRWLLVVG